MRETDVSVKHAPRKPHDAFNRDQGFRSVYLYCYKKLLKLKSFQKADAHLWQAYTEFSTIQDQHLKCQYVQLQCECRCSKLMDFLQ
jgi:hypothetical protein